MPIRSYYSAEIRQFLSEGEERILGFLAKGVDQELDKLQRHAWLRQIAILRIALKSLDRGRLYFEFFIPRMGKRADVVLVVDGVVFVLEFKVGANSHAAFALRQVEDYALDLKNFHEGSHSCAIIPIAVATDAPSALHKPLVFAADNVAQPLTANADELGWLIEAVLSQSKRTVIDVSQWEAKGYRPTPTIIEAAQVLYETHKVEDIARFDAGAKNLAETTAAVNEVVDVSRCKGRKSICFVTGVPGSGKTLAGLNIATNRSDEHQDEHAVFLSGNGPLVIVLREALTRDKASREGITKEKAKREVSTFIQNIHHFRDEYLRKDEVPSERVVIFDEAQRAWTKRQASKFMRERGVQNFDASEPEFLISVMDRHFDWCTIVCLVGGGQEINTGEAGIGEWIHALQSRFQGWDVFLSPRILAPEYGVTSQVQDFVESGRAIPDDRLHLQTSMRSFRAESLSEWVRCVVENDSAAAQSAYDKIRESYPIYLTRNLDSARAWVRNKARGNERYGLVASSGGLRLRPEGIHIKAKVDPANWFLNDQSDVRSSYYLEEVATEFDIQGLELDWVAVAWDADFFRAQGEWMYRDFKGTKWTKISDPDNRSYLKNAYRVLLTRARQGMILFIPNGSASDATRTPSFYDGTFEYLKACGVPELC